MKDDREIGSEDGLSHHPSPITHHSGGLSHHPSPITHHQAPFGRLRWHSRRGMLELDILLGRFWARFGERLDSQDAQALERILDLEDNDLLELILSSTDGPSGDARVLAMLRES